MNVLDKINFKAEDWKFTPKSAFKDDLIMGDGDFLKEMFYMGPNETTLSEQSWADLEEQGFIKISKEVRIFKNWAKKATTVKATLSPVFDDFLRENGRDAESLRITFLKNLPSPLWLTLGLMSTSVEFCFAEKVKVDLVFIEKELDLNKVRFFPIDFKLEKFSNVDVFFNYRASGKSTSFSHAEIEEEAHLRVFGLYGGKSDYKRTDFRSFQTSPKSEITFNGLSFLKGSSVVDYHTDSFHLSTDQRTHQTYKTIGGDQSKNIFGGRIHLTTASEGAEVDQINRNILLGKKATVDTQPELNIDQDDVKATHGAATSALDDEHFFYMASRGFPKEQSRKLLMDAFCKDAFLSDVTKGIQEYFMNQVQEDLDNV